MKLDIAKSFKKKNSKYGGYATLVTAAVLAILIVLNLIASSLDLKLDLTKNKLFSLSKESSQVLSSLKQNITIYAFFESGKEDTAIKSVLDKYGEASKKITVQYKDPVKYPEFAKKYNSGTNTVQAGSVVVECGSKFKLIGYSDLFNLSYDNYGNATADSLNAEQRITGAINYVTSDKNPTLYVLQGHSEGSVSSDITSQFENQNYTIKDLNLLQSGAKLEKGSVLLVMQPEKDLTSDETAQIKSFLADSGRAIFLMGITQQDNLPNFMSVLSAYGVGINRKLVIEGDSKYSATNPIVLIPQLESHDITSALTSSNLPVVLPVSQAITTLSVKKSSTTIEPLLTTSKSSYAKANLQTQTSERDSGDVSGPFNVAVAITDKSSSGNATKDTRIVLVANSSFATTQYAKYGGNVEFLANCTTWLQDEGNSLYIAPKSLSSDNLNITGANQILISALVVIVIPLIVTVLGIRVWLRRRHQ